MFYGNGNGKEDQGQEHVQYHGKNQAQVQPQFAVEILEVVDEDDEDDEADVFAYKRKRGRNLESDVALKGREIKDKAKKGWRQRQRTYGGC